jgi:hypothetical protein
MPGKFHCPSELLRSADQRRWGTRPAIKGMCPRDRKLLRAEK